MGADGSPTVPTIGQQLQRPVEAVPGATVGAPAVDYAAMQPVLVQPGWRATFLVHQPLGREPVLGQYFHWTVEVRDATGSLQHRTVPLRAVVGGSAPGSGR
jgi:hypothetical protein